MTSGSLITRRVTTPDYWLRLRLLGYCCRIWERDRQEYQEVRSLRPILPLVFYPTGWRHSPQFADLFPAATRDWPWLPRFEHLLFDQTQVSPAQAAGSVRARLLQLTMMHAFSRAVREARQRMRPLLGRLGAGRKRRAGRHEDVRAVYAGDGTEDTPDEIGHPAVRQEPAWLIETTAPRTSPSRPRSSPARLAADACSTKQPMTSEPVECLGMTSRPTTRGVLRPAGSLLCRAAPRWRRSSGAPPNPGASGAP